MTVRNIPVRDMTWSDLELELVVERAPVQPYLRRLNDGAWLLVCEVLLGFAGAFFMGVPILLFLLLHTSLTKPEDRHHHHIKPHKARNTWLWLEM